MSKSQKICSGDVRRLIRTARELVELPADGEVRLRHLLENLRELTRCQMAVAGPMVDYRPGGSPTITAATEAAWLDDDQRRAFLAYLGDEHAADPMLPVMVSTPGEVVTLTRRMAMPDRDWYESRHYREYRRWAGVDNCLYCFRRLGPAEAFALGLHRAVGDRPFTAREVQLVSIAVEELAWAYDVPPDPRIAERARLSPRVGQVLDRLLVGDSEKQIAVRLCLSRHTVHEHVKALYQRCGVSSRAELLAYWLGAR